MTHRGRTIAILLCTSSFLSVSLLAGTVTHGARLRIGTQKPKNAIVDAGKTGRSDPGALDGEWRVTCVARTYRKGAILSSTQDTDESLIVAETDTDGSYRLYKFPAGFGEAFPRLRRTFSNQYAGDDTVNGITTVVKQDIDIENGKITIKQVTIDAPSKQTENDISCTGARQQSELKLPVAESKIESCHSASNQSGPPDPKIARKYQSMKPFSDGLAAVAIASGKDSNLRWGFVDKSGKVVIPIVYDSVSSFQDGLAVVAKSYGRGRNLKWGVIEKLGPQVTPNVHYDAVKILGEGFAAVGYARADGHGLKWNLINRENTTILHGFDDFGCFANGRARASYTENNIVRTGFINKVGAFYQSEN